MNHQSHLNSNEKHSNQWGTLQSDNFSIETIENGKRFKISCINCLPSVYLIKTKIDDTVVIIRFTIIK